MRKYCLDCVIKHLGQAFVLNLEMEAGYSEHELLLIGHLAEASEECYGISQEIANEIRQYRLALLEDSKFQIPYFEIYEKIQKIKDEKGCGDCKKTSDDFKNKLAERLKSQSL